MSNTITGVAGTVEHLDPTTLVIDDNVRAGATVEKGFIDSIRENGVLSPILGWRDPNGVVHVRAGQRRTLAAREAGVGSVPVYIVDGVGDDDGRRIIEQLVENDQRAQISEAERVQAWKCLELEGLSATAIAKRTGAKRERVKTGLTVAASETASSLLGAVGLTLDQAAALIEFDGDDETIASLTEIADTDPAYFPVALQRARNDRAAADARTTVEAGETAKGHFVLAERPPYNGTPYRLRMLTTADGDPVDQSEIQGKPGVLVYVESYYGGDARPEYFIDNPTAFGYLVREDVQVVESHVGPMTDEQKAERKTLIANNKEWDAAETVRREWLASLLSRKTLPKDAIAVLATLLSTGRSRIGEAMTHGNTMARDLLAIEPGIGSGLAEFVEAHPARALHAALAVALGGVEESTGRETWRYPRPDTAAYLATIQAWGYTLTPVERIAAMLPNDREAVTAE